MSLSGSLSNALSGLTAAARATEIVSSNISNAMTEGHARRELQLAPRLFGGLGGGVQVTGVKRVVDQSILGDRRLADAAVADSRLRSDFHKQLELALGSPTVPNSISGRISTLDTALVEAASRPDSEGRLASVMTAANDLAASIRSVAQQVSDARTNADRAISRDVDFVNSTLKNLDEMNARILAQTAAGRDTSALLDQRQAMIDGLSKVIPVVEMPRDNNQIALFSKGGAILLDGGPAELSFTPKTYVTPEMSQALGDLSGLKLNGQAIPTGTTGILSGGSLGAAFQLRDELAPAAQVQLDAVARNLIDRFAAPGLDTTRPAGQPGLFTDKGAALDPAKELGLANRLTTNALPDPARGGALWRLRDGLGATAPGDVGNGSLLSALDRALNTPQAPASGNFLGAARSLSGVAADLLSQVSSQRLGAEADTAYATARQETLKTLHLSDGVDTDAEMQRLLQIEQAYAANARVVQTIDDMLSQLLRW
ncbi:flagellar hook-associated protein FlgK [Paracoccus sp. p4-l81]|uniref:flagellar hook-associated protein FlgK n=1 Tax=Paracoccus sp. p4-l81 TaxID=3342806 RepID=UPI0035BAE227